MNKYIIGTILNILLINVYLSGQKIADSAIGQVQKIYIDVKKPGEIVYPYRFVKGSSIYNLSKAFQMEEKKIYKFNNLKENRQINENELIFIPISENKIVYTTPKNKKFVVLLYTIKKGETLYHIAKRKMAMQPELLKKINGLSDDSIREGGELIIGWYVFDQVKTEKNKIEKPNAEGEKISHKKDTSGKANYVSTITKNEIKKTKDVSAAPAKKLVSKKVIGFWDKENQSKNGLFVLSNNNKQGSKVEIYYPMNKTSVIATVLGKIPAQTYEEEIEVVISPEVAKKLGIFDSRYSVEIRHYELIHQDN
ncbi:MAG: LysM peptidoglycan-binding domain-containing protein [Saprospiraceae bacterium]|nr:LysM peptidoglycan-binding domain-containing protein [Saprospiraceae bacterium]